MPAGPGKHPPAGTIAPPRSLISFVDDFAPSPLPSATMAKASRPRTAVRPLTAARPLPAARAPRAVRLPPAALPPGRSPPALGGLRLNRRKLGDQIADLVIERIAAGALIAGARLPAESALAQLFGASVPVVREALAILIRRNLVHRRHGKGSFVRTDALDWLAGRATRQGVIGLAIRHADGADYFGQVFNQAVPGRPPRQMGVQVFDPAPGGAAQVAEEAMAAGLSGLVWTQHADAAELDALAEVRARLPVVLLNVPAGGAALASVHTDDAAGGLLAARHLRERGHQRIGVITNFPAASPHRERLAGLAAGGIDGDPGLRLVLAGYRPSAPERQECRALASRCSALMLTSGYLFTALLGDLAACARRIGDDLALLVFDDFEALSAHHPPVSAIRQPLAELAALAVAMIGDAAKGLPLARSAQLLAPQLVVRAATLGPVR